jgi:hypothetical protein
MTLAEQAMGAAQTPKETELARQGERREFVECSPP